MTLQELKKRLRDGLGKYPRSTKVSIDKDTSIVSVAYHNTNVVSVMVDSYSDKLLVFLNTGGYETVTTKKRMNDCLKALGIPYYVFQQNFTWKVGMYDSEYNHSVIMDNMPSRVQILANTSGGVTAIR